MDPDDRPTIRALVGWWSPAFGILGDPLLWPRVMSLEDAADYARAGATVMLDPFDLEDFATWERMQRMLETPRKRGRSASS